MSKSDLFRLPKLEVVLQWVLYPQALAETSPPGDSKEPPWDQPVYFVAVPFEYGYYPPHLSIMGCEWFFSSKDAAEDCAFERTGKAENVIALSGKAAHSIAAKGYALRAAAGVKYTNDSAGVATAH